MNKKTTEDGVVRIGDLWQEPVSFRVEVVKEGNCRAYQKQGQTFEFIGNTPEGMCAESFVGMYPVLHSLRVLGDMRELGSPQRNVRIYNCPRRVIQFEITATYRCNLCGESLPIKNDEVQVNRLENSEHNLRVRVCSACADKYGSKVLEW